MFICKSVFINLNENILVNYLYDLINYNLNVFFKSLFVLINVFLLS